MGWRNRKQGVAVLRQFINNTAPSKIEATTRDIAHYAVEKATEFSPFQTGRFMASWRIGKTPSVGGPAGAGRRGDEFTAATEAVMASTPVIKSIKMGQNFYLGNNVPYAEYVEYGSLTTPAYNITIRVSQSIGAVFGRIRIAP